MKDIVDKQIPTLCALKSAGEISVENIDVFCEKGVFDAKQTQTILEVSS